MSEGFATTGFGLALRRETMKLESGQIWVYDDTEPYVIVSNEDVDNPKYIAVWFTAAKSSSQDIAPREMYTDTTLDWQTAEQMMSWINNDRLLVDAGNIWADLHTSIGRIMKNDKTFGVMS